MTLFSCQGNSRYFEKKAAPKPDEAERRKQIVTLWGGRSYEVINRKVRLRREVGRPI